MKKLLIAIIIIILVIFVYNKYNDYQRYHPKNTDYKVSQNIDLDYYNQEAVYNYFNAIEDLNGFVTMQWTAEDIDVINPKDDDEEVVYATKQYAKKLAKVKYYEAKLEQSKAFKDQGLSNDDVKLLSETGQTKEVLDKIDETAKIKSMFNPVTNLRLGEKSAFIYEVQKLLVKKGHDIPVDGVYQNITRDAILQFETKSKLFTDGNLDVLTLEALLK